MVELIMFLRATVQKLMCLTTQLVYMMWPVKKSTYGPTLHTSVGAFNEILNVAFLSDIKLHQNSF